MDVDVAPLVVQVRLGVSERRTVLERAVHRPSAARQGAVEHRHLVRAHHHVDVGAERPGSQGRIDGGTLDVQDVGADPVGDVLDGRMPELQAHLKRHADP
ncbi:hypothetical protein GCM10025870_19740 [Agromyces marinus]|uniref:Uncharacterized protein n=1 Tax=Agromyces marinus TaxID=1389020 RepID=A0ABM8H278_9MICO|nr:hypothetical protein GCM10025870_19740 [Agromyces marinus]